MRSAGNFHPEWGYLAPAPSFMRTLRVALVALAIGATAGAAVMVSLVERPVKSSGNTSIAAHALVTSIPVANRQAAAASPVVDAAATRHPPEQLAAQQDAQSPSPAQPASVASTPAAPSAMSVPPISATPVFTPAMKQVTVTASPPPPPASAAATASAQQPLTDSATKPAGNDIGTADTAPAKKVVTRKRHTIPYAARRWPPSAAEAKPEAGSDWARDGGFGPLLNLFSSRTNSPYSSN